MGAWYQVVKVIKGHRYLYEQRTWREGKRVRTENRYIGKVSEAHDGITRPVQASDFDGVITTPHTFYHGTPDEIEGAFEPSDEGTFGPGFYLSTKERAKIYAQYDAGIAAGIIEREEGSVPSPQYDGTVYGFDVRSLKLKVFNVGRYQNLCSALDPLEAPTSTAKAKLTAQLAAEGYDGLYILGQERHELVVFSGSLHKFMLRVRYDPVLDPE